MNEKVVENTNVHRRSRRRWVIRIVAVVVLLIGIHALWTFLSGRAALQEAIQETDALDPRWRLEHLMADRAKMPAEENSALIILVAFQLEDRSDSKKLAEAEITGLDDVWERDQYRLNEVQKKALDVLLRAQEKSLPEYRKIAKMPKRRYPDFVPRENAPHELPPSVRAREAFRALRIGFLDCLERGDHAGEIQDIHGMINVASSLGEEQTSLATSMRYFIRQSAPFSIRRWIAQEQPKEADLGDFQKLLEFELQLPLLVKWVRINRADGFENFEQAIANVNRPKNNIDRAIRFAHQRIWDVGQVARIKAEYLRIMNQIIDVCSMSPSDRLGELTRLEQTVAANPELKPFVAFIFNRIKDTCLRSDAVVTCAITALAAERFRIQQQRWPASLDEFVAADFLKSVPIDPYDGNALRWKITDRGAIVYSIGKDGTDDEGAYDPSKPTEPGNDIVFRLYDPAHRRQPPLPPKVVEPENP